MNINVDISIRLLLILVWITTLCICNGAPLPPLSPHLCDLMAQRLWHITTKAWSHSWYITRGVMCTHKQNPATSAINHVE